MPQRPTATKCRRSPALRYRGCLAPRAAWDAGADHETIVAMPQTVVVGDAAGDGAHPVPIEPLQLIRIAHALRRAQIDTGIPELHAPIAGREISRFRSRY